MKENTWKSIYSSHKHDRADRHRTRRQRCSSVSCEPHTNTHKVPAETDFTAMTAGESRLVPESWAYTFKRAVQTTCRATQWYREKTNRGRGFRWLLVYLFFLLFNISKPHNHLTGIQAPAATSFQCNIALLCAELVVKVNCVTSLHNLPSEPQNLKKIK